MIWNIFETITQIIFWICGATFIAVMATAIISDIFSGKQLKKFRDWLKPLI